MIILVDMDNVLADTESGFIDAWKRKFPNEPFIPKRDRKSVRFSDEYPLKKVNEVFGEKGFFLPLALIPGGKEALEHMAESGHTVYICTVPFYDYTYCLAEKYQWIETNIGKEWTEKMVITRDKTIINGDILIDDHPSITGAAKPVWEQYIYTQPYNIHIKDKKRLTWETWQEVLPL